MKRESSMANTVMITLTKVNSRWPQPRPISFLYRPSLHRVAGFVLGLFCLYLALTGLVIQFADLHALLTHAAESDPVMMAIRESIDGTPNYTVIGASGYAAPSLPLILITKGPWQRCCTASVAMLVSTLP